MFILRCLAGVKRAAIVLKLCLRAFVDEYFCTEHFNTRTKKCRNMAGYYVFKIALAPQKKLHMKKLASNILPVVFILLIGCKNNPTTVETITANATSTAVILHPDWIMQGNIYEVNMRQYTKEGTFKAFEANLDRLKEMGVQALWFMPITPISKIDRKGTLGSYYAVADYTGINPEYGNLADWKHLVNTAHEKGFKVLTDWVANHTGADNGWLTRHPDFFEKDSSGKAAYAFDWSDTRSLDFTNNEMRDSMIAAMKYWLTETNIDGFRCDVAGEVPDDFWKTCIAELKKVKPILMLAEGDKGSLHGAGFNISYAWNMFQMTKKIAMGERPASAIDSIVNQVDSTFPENALRLYFTSNHDENSWNMADYGTMPGASHAPFAVLTQTMVRGIPLVYSGQEEPVLKKIEFFEKDAMPFGKFGRAKFYKTLLELRKNNAALAADASFKKVVAGNEKAVYAFVREKAAKKVLVILNLSNKLQTLQVKEKEFYGKPFNVFMNTTEPLNDRQWQIDPWGYVIYEARN